MFADDTKIWTKISGINDTADLQKDLDSLSTLSAEWQLKFNTNKCKVMHIGHQYKTNYTIWQDNTDFSILEITEEKYLGVLTASTIKSRDSVMKRLLKQTESWAWFIDSLKIWTFLIKASLDHTWSMQYKHGAHIWKGTLNT